MIALHKPERATYGQAVEAQEEYYYVKCDHTGIECKYPGGPYTAASKYTTVKWVHIAVRV